MPSVAIGANRHFVRPPRLSVRLSDCPERAYGSSSLRILCICLKFGGFMQNIMEQMAIWMAMFGQFLSVSRNFEISNDRLRLSLIDDVAASTI